MSRILIIGTGGHARVVASLIENMGKFRIQGFLDTGTPDLKEKILGHSVIGSVKDASLWFRKKIRFAALALGDNAERSAAYKSLVAIGFAFPPLIHRRAVIEPHAEIKDASQICMGAMIGASARVGVGCIVNTGSIVDHETVLAPWVHVAPGCAIAGRVKIGEGSFIGIGSRIIDTIHIGAWSTIGAGSVVVDNIPDGTTAYGIPARPQKKL